jgi:hypothetical protein
VVPRSLARQDLQGVEDLRPRFLHVQFDLGDELIQDLLEHRPQRLSARLSERFQGDNIATRLLERIPEGGYPEPGITASEAGTGGGHWGRALGAGTGGGHWRPAASDQRFTRYNLGVSAANRVHSENDTLRTPPLNSGQGISLKFSRS